MRQRFLFLFSLLFLVAICFAIEDDFYSKDNGFVLLRVKDGKMVLSHNEQKEFSYASNVKLITTLAALQELGSFFTFKTKFKIVEDTLFVKAGADPTLVNEDLFKLSIMLKQQMITPISTYVIDESIFEGVEVATKSQNSGSGRAYYAQLSPISLNYNTFQIEVVPSGLGKKPHLYLRTPGSYFVLQNRAITRPGKTKLKAQATRAKNKTEVVIQGNINIDDIGQSYSFRVFHPTAHFVSVLSYALGGQRSPNIVFRKLEDELFTGRGSLSVESKKIGEVVKLMNYYSSNFISTSLAAHLARHTSKKNGTQALESYVFGRFKKKISLTSASGLGKNMLTPDFIIRLLAYAQSKPLLALDFFGSLPTYGRDGTLKDTKGFETEDVLRAKTGSLRGVNSISGIMTASSGELFLFTFVTNKKNLYQKGHIQQVRNRFLKQIWSEN